ncbi:MAG TPA: FAD:protein FMN transferase [Xanthomonadaceae bacterium]|nr:FAD:protein FMN transferase [Xanthomonadaceae bacterium]
MSLRATLLLAAALAIAAVTWLRPPVETTVRERLFVFGSLADIEVRHADARAAKLAISSVAALWSDYHRDWHPWQDGALVRLNADLAAGRTARDVPPSLLELIELGRRFEDESGGLLNPSIGALVAAWGFHGSDYPVRGMPPDSAELERLLQPAPSMRALHVEGNRVTGTRPLQLDFSAIAEGKALAAAAEELRRYGIAHALLAMGGDVLAMGQRGDRPWRVAIGDPRDGILAEVELGDGEALFSAGGYQRYREDGDTRLPHLIDPHSGRPAQGALASTVLHDDPVRADAAATAMAIGGADLFERLVVDMAVPCALLLDHDGRLHATPGMIERLRIPKGSAPVYARGAHGPCRSKGELRENAPNPKASP